MRCSSKYWTTLAGIFLISATTFFYCEYYYYYITISKCKWLPLELSPEYSSDPRIMILADTHLLGKRNGHWFDKLRREWQMYRSFQTSVELLSPDAVVILGDIFDEGKWSSDEEFTEYVRRFEELFYLPENVKLIVAVGNHDIGFHYRTNPYLVSRFDQAFSVTPIQLHEVKGVKFVTVNSVAMEGDNCFLCKPARMQLERLNKLLRCKEDENGSCVYKDIIRRENRPVLLQHYPMYRKSDAHCREPDEAPPHLKEIHFKEKFDCLSKEATRLLLKKLQPRLIFSGHTHYGCESRHNTSIEGLPEGGEQSKTFIKEFNIASFSWRNIVNPSFFMLTASPLNYSVQRCSLPNESVVKLMYTLALGLIVIWIVFRHIRRFSKKDQSSRKFE